MDNDTLLGMELAITILRAMIIQLRREAAEKMSKQLEEALREGDL